MLLFGSFRALTEGQALTEFHSNKTRALLAYLMVESHRPQRRDSLVGLLWPHTPDTSARRSLSQTLYTLRELIADQNARPPFLTISRDAIQFNTASDYTLDVARFRQLLVECERHAHAGIEACAECAGRLCEATALYQGKFLEDFFVDDSEAFEDWAVVQREALNQAALRALTQLADYHERLQAYDAALKDINRQLELEPWREEAHRQKMRVLALNGQRSAALAQYETCKRLLADELGVEPAGETTALYAHIKAGTLAGRDARAQQPTPTQLGGKPRSLPPQMPSSRTPFIGRERELAELSELLARPEVRLITLMGPGGIGKTRLAVQLASQQFDQFKHGAAFVPLAALPSTDLIEDTIASAVGLTFNGPAGPRLQLQNHLRDKQMLMVFDNFEHLLGPANSVDNIADILQAAPAVKVLVTSREPLNVQDEWLYDLSGLGEYSQALFMQCARRMRAGFSADSAEAGAIDRICRLVGGMPLGIELAASWVRVLSCAEIASEIERNLNFLATNARDMPERHRSMTVVFDNSWQLLSDEERRVMRRLSVFQGGFRREAAERVAGASLTVLSSLVAKSLVRRLDTGRYELHGLVQQYAATALRQDRAEWASALESHLTYFLALAQAADAEINGPSQITWLNQLSVEHDNFRQAIDRVIRAEELPFASDDLPAIRAMGAQLAAALGQFWFIRGYHREGSSRIEQMLRIQPSERVDGVRVKMLTLLGFFALLRDDPPAARTWLTQAVASGREAGDRQALAEGLHILGLFEFSQGNIDAARAAQAESAAIAQEIGNYYSIGLALTELGSCAMAENDHTAAEAMYREGARLLAEVHDKNQLAAPLRRLGHIALQRGDYAEALRRFQESLMLNVEVGDRRGAAACLAGVACVAEAQDDLPRAVRLMGAAEGLLATVSDSFLPSDRMSFDPFIARIRARLAEPKLAQAWTEGQALTLEQAVDSAVM